MPYIRDVYLLESDPLRAFLKRKLSEVRYANVAFRRTKADVFVISFPKSGRTWHRVLLGSYLKALLKRPDLEAADIDGLTHAEEGARVTYSHNGANFDDGLPAAHPAVANSALWRGKKVIFIVREPKDVMVSAWFHAHHRTHRYSGTLAEFVRSPLAGIVKLVAARNRWWENRDRAAAHAFFSYEQMHADAAAVLRSTLAFIGRWPIDEGLIAEAVAQSSFSAMQRSEAAGTATHASLRKRSEGVAGFKAREGKAGGYARHLTADDIAYIDEAVRAIRDPLAALYSKPAANDAPPAPANGAG